jgi:hypothetical protein
MVDNLNIQIKFPTENGTKAVELTVDLKWSIKEFDNEVMEKLKVAGCSINETPRYALAAYPSRKETEIETSRACVVADLNLENRSTIIIRVKGEEISQGNYPTEPHESVSRLKFGGNGRVLKDGTTELRRSQRSKTAETSQLIKSRFDEDGNERQAPTVRETKTTRAQSKIKNNKRKDPNAFKGDGRELKSGDVIEGKKTKSSKNAMEDSKGEVAGPSDQELLTIILRKRIWKDKMFLNDSDINPYEIYDRFVKGWDREMYMSEMKKSASEDEARTISEAVLRGDYNITPVERAEELKLNELDDYGCPKLSNSTEGTFWATFKPIGDNLSVNTHPVKKKVTILIDKTSVIREIEDVIDVMIRYKKLELWFQGYMFVKIHANLYWSIVKQYNNEKNSSGAPAQFRDMLELILPHMNWHFVFQRESDAIRDRKLSVIGEESKKYLENDTEE